MIVFSGSVTVLKPPSQCCSFVMGCTLTRVGGQERPVEIGSRDMGTLDCRWGRIEVGEFSKSQVLSMSNLFPGTKVGALPRVSFAMAFAGGRVFGRVSFGSNRPSSFSTKRADAGQLKSFELRSSRRHESEGVCCTRGPVGLASMATANTIAVMKIVMRAVAVVIFLGSCGRFRWKIYVIQK